MNGIKLLDFFTEFPKDLQNVLFNELDLKTITIARQVSKEWNQFFNGPIVNKLVAERELSFIYLQDTINQDLEKLFIDHSKTFNKDKKSFAQAFLEFCRKTNQNFVVKEPQQLKECAKMRFAVWKYFLKNEPSLVSVEKEVSYLRDAVNKQLKEKKSKVTFDQMYKHLKETIKSPWRDFHFVFEQGYFLLYVLCLDIGIINENSESSVLSLLMNSKIRKYFSSVNNSFEVPKPLFCNAPYLVQLSFKSGCNPKHTFYNNDYDENGHSYLEKLISAFDPKNAFKGEKKYSLETLHACGQQVEEIGLMLLQNGSPMSQGHMLTAGRLKLYELTYALAKEWVKFSKTSESYYSIFGMDRMHDPFAAQYVLKRFWMQKVPLSEICPPERSLLADVIGFLSSNFSETQEMSKEAWEQGWLKVAEQLIQMGEDPKRTYSVKVRTMIDERSWSTSSVKMNIVEFAKNKGLTKLVELFEKPPSKE